MGKIIQVYHNDAETLQNICRVDFTGRRVGSINRTDEGYLTGIAPIAKIGILTYFLEDGTTRRELVNENTLFNNDSIKTLRMKPVTDQHPPERALDSRTVKRRKVGFTGENIKRDGEFLMVPVTVTDHDAIENVDGGRRELSPGYRCDLLLEPGEFNGQPYDGIQLNRRYNHVAICDRARGGSDLKLHLDSIEDLDQVDGFEVNDAVLTSARRKALPDSAFCFVRGTGDTKVRKFPAHDAAHVRNGLARLKQSNLTADQKAEVLACLKRKAEKFGVQISNKDDSIDDIVMDEYNLSEKEKQLINRKEKRMPNFRIDGIDYEAAQEVINFATKETARADAAESKVDGLTTENKDLKAKVDALEGERDGLKTKVDELEKVDHTEAINKGVSERLEVLDAVAAVIPEDKRKEMKIDDMSNVDLKKAVILAKSPDAKLDDRGDDYLNARYDAIVEGLGFDPNAIGNARKKAAHRNDADPDPVEKARKDSEDRITSDYETLGGRVK